MDVRSHQSRAWDRLVNEKNEWTRPVSADEIAAARAGRWSVVLTPTRPVPATWFGELRGKHVLGLASGGGQQGPLFAAAGAHVTILDNSKAQLAQDQAVAEKEGLTIRLEHGDMADLSRFSDASFDLVFNPCSNSYAEHVPPIWREAARVLRPGGALLAGFANPVTYLFDPDQKEGPLVATHTLPYSDLNVLPADVVAQRIAEDRPFEFGHTLEDQIGAQLEAGLHLVGFFEDRQPGYALDLMIPTYIATRAIKP